MGRILFIAIVAFILSACGEENLERADFNVYFYYPNMSREEFLGLAKGLSACQAMASNRAGSLNMTRSTGWSYICCKKTPFSNCASKHK
jgi:hypothetical protein